MLTSFHKNKVLISLICFHSFVAFNQNGFKFGIKAHPNLSFSTIADKSNIASDNFSSRNGILGLNLGICANYKLKNWLFEINSAFKTNTVSLKFKNETTYSKVSIRSLAFANDFNLGYRVYESSKPHYEIFALLNFGGSLVAIQGLNGSIRSVDALQYNFIVPDINTEWSTVNIGTGIRIRAQLKSLRTIDYGISYQYFIQKYPEIGMKISQGGQIYEGIAGQNVHSLNFDFIFYFGKRKKQEA